MGRRSELWLQHTMPSAQRTQRRSLCAYLPAAVQLQCLRKLCSARCMLPWSAAEGPAEYWSGLLRLHACLPWWYEKQMQQLVASLSDAQSRQNTAKCPGRETCLCFDACAHPAGMPRACKQCPFLHAQLSYLLNQSRCNCILTRRCAAACVMQKRKQAVSHTCTTGRSRSLQLHPDKCCACAGRGCTEPAAGRQGALPGGAACTRAAKSAGRPPSRVAAAARPAGALCSGWCAAYMRVSVCQAGQPVHALPNLLAAHHHASQLQHGQLVRCVQAGVLRTCVCACVCARARVRVRVRVSPRLRVQQLAAPARLCQLSWDAAASKLVS